MISSNGAYKAVQSGQFSKSNNTKSEFTSIILKEEKSKLKQFTWSTEYKCYKKKVDRDLDLVPYTLNLDDLEFSEDFIQEFYKDTQGNFNVIDYFVFPIVTCRNIYEDNETNLIGTFEEVNEIISRNKLIIFEGPESSGKTTVLKYLHKKLISDNIVLFTNGYELKSIRNPKKLLKNLFLNQYQDVIEEKFYKYNINQRILIIDDAENKTEFINKLQNYFGKIIITLTKTKSDKIIDIIMKDILNKDETSLLEINYFYRKKRVELAKRMYTTIMKNNGREVNNRAINKFTVKFNNVIETRLSFFGLSPLNIFFLVYHLAIKNNEEFRNIYNDVFTSNLTMQIKRSADKNELKNYKPYVTATQKIAFEMNKNTTNFMTSNQINDVIIKYNKDYNQAVKLREYLNVMSESKILVEPELDHWYFNNKNFLAYYASQEYVYLSNYYEKNKHIFNDLLKNIHIGVNDKILLFLAFSQQNERIIIEILRQSDMLFEGIDEMELNKFNFLNKPQI
jgi:hypothetical protein